MQAGQDSLWAVEGLLFWGLWVSSLQSSCAFLGHFLNIPRLGFPILASTHTLGRCGCWEIMKVSLGSVAD